MSRPARTGPLSILHVHGRFDGGAKDRRVVRLMNHWAARATHDVLLASPGSDAARTGIDPAVAVRFLDEPAFGPGGGPGRYVALAQLMRDYDLVLSYGWGAIDAVVTQRLLGLLMSLPPLIHHEDGEKYREVGPLGFGGDLYRRYSLGAAHALVVPTGRLAHIAIDQWGESAAHVRQIPNGIDVAAYDAPPAVPALMPDGRLVLGARVEDATPAMLDALLRAVAPVQDKVRLVLLDAPGEDAALSARSQALGITGLSAPADLPPPRDYLAALDAFIWLGEGGASPDPLAEAMAAGLPVIATDTGDIAEMLAQPNRALIVAPGNDAGLARPLARLVEDAALRKSLGAANHRRALQCFDESVMFDLYGRLYGSAAGRDEALT
jgi:glycosyltransferase involved in cell wall biosynthesis